MKKMLVLALLVLIAVAVPSSAEEIKLSTIVPDQQLVRGRDGAIGSSYINKTDTDVTDGNLIVEGNVGVGVAIPQATLDVNGGVKVGSATTAPEGTIRYNAGIHAFEYQNGTGSWVPLGSGWVYKNILVYEGAVSTNAWGNTIDLSSSSASCKVGSNKFVLLKVRAETTSENFGRFRFKPGGDTDDYNTDPLTGANSIDLNAGDAPRAGLVTLTTGDNGKIQFSADSANSIHIYLVGYIS